MTEIRALLREAAPASVSEVDLGAIARRARGRRRQRRGLVGTAGLAAAALLGVGALAVVDHQHGGPKRLTVRPSANPSDTRPTSPPLSCPPDPPTQPVICPATSDAAERLIGSALPPPEVPPGFVLGLSKIFFADGHPAQTLFERSWTPPGELGPHGATGAFLELRVTRDAAHGGSPALPPQPGAVTITLRNGARATEFDSDQYIQWSHAGLEYTLESARIPFRELLQAANGLP